MKIQLLFDLDGTISDPLPGFVKSINYALKHNGYPERETSELAKYIGPPLDETLMTLTGKTDPETIKQYVKKYRERYISVGYSENTLYKGISQILDKLDNQNVRMAICTSKRADMADKILQMFGLRHHFEFISGGDIGIFKWQQIAELKKKKLVDSNTIMIGDRAVDLSAAHKNHLRSAGVRWGYGSKHELKNQRPEFILKTPEQLLKLIRETALP